MGLHPNRSRAGAAAAVRGGKRLVQVEVHDIEAHVARPGDPDEAIGVGPVVVGLHARLGGSREISRIAFSKRPKVFGLVSITAATRVEILLLKSSRSTSPSGPDLTVTVFRRERGALAGLVPCALSGTSASSRVSPRVRWYAWIMRSPVHSPCAPAAGCRLIRSIAVSASRARSSSHISRKAPWARAGGW